MTKICTKCQILKDETEFNKRTIKGRQYYYSWCKACAKIMNVELARKRKEKRTLAEQEKISQTSREYFKIYYSTVRGRAIHLLNKARNRARGKYECSVSVDFIMKKLENNKCEQTGIDLEWENTNAKLSRNPRSPSIDRIDANKGYTDDNVQIVCTWYNLAKSQLTDADMLKFCQNVVEFNMKKRGE